MTKVDMGGEGCRFISWCQLFISYICHGLTTFEIKILFCWYSEVFIGLDAFRRCPWHLSQTKDYKFCIKILLKYFKNYHRYNKNTHFLFQNQNFPHKMACFYLKLRLDAFILNYFDGVNFLLVINDTVFCNPCKQVNRSLI